MSDLPEHSVNLNDVPDDVPVDPKLIDENTIFDEYDQVSIKQESPLPPQDDNILPGPEQVTNQILPEPVTMPSVDPPGILPARVIGSVPSPRSSSSSSLNTLDVAGFKAVKGRPKIMLCSRCKTFVSRDKLDSHTLNKCNSIIKKRENNRGSGCTCRKRKRRVDPEFIKDFRRLKKENATAAAAALVAVKKINQLKKKMSKKKLKSLPKDVKNLFSFLEKKFSK